MGKKRIVKESGTEETAKASGSAEKTKPAAEGKRFKSVEHGRIYIQASYNNTLASLTDDRGNLIAQTSAGAAGFKGPRKATPYAANKIIEILTEKMKKIGLKDLAVFVKGIGSGREAAVRALVGQGVNVTSIKDITPVPHNGPKSRKPRRV